MTNTTTTGAIGRLIRMSRSVHRNASAAGMGVTLKQYATLSTLRELDGQCPQGELREVMCIDANNLVLLLNELEAAGFVVRARDPSDRRRHIVTMTKDGHAAVERADVEMESLEPRVLGGLSVEERAELSRLLERALAAVPPT